MLNKKRLIIGTLCIFLLGSMLHFAFELLGRTALAAPFFAVNESVWEHMKLLYTAAAVWLAVEWFIMEKYLRPCFFAVRAIALPIALLAIPTIFYLFEGALGLESLIIDLLIFLASAFMYQFLVMRLERNCTAYSRFNKLGISVLCLLFVLFAVFTFLPPHLPIFLDTEKRIFGIQK